MGICCANHATTLSSKVDSNFADKRRSLGQYSLLADLVLICEDCGRKWSRPILRYSSNICLERLSKTTRNSVKVHRVLTGTRTERLASQKYKNYLTNMKQHCSPAFREIASILDRYKWRFPWIWKFGGP
jgi:hypothetical protein